MMVDTQENYIKAVTPHLDDTVVTQEQYHTVEKTLNSHLSSMVHSGLQKLES